MRPMLLLLLAACDDGAPSSSDSAGTEDSGTPVDTAPEVIEGDADTDADSDADTDADVDDDDAYEAFYNPNTVQKVYLTVSEADQDLLRQDGATYVSATYEHDGEEVENVGLRVKGSSTLRTWDEKASLK